VKFESASRDVIEDIAVMRDQQQRAAEALTQMLLEPFDRGDVEMIRRLVEDREVGLADEQARQCDPSAFAAGQCFDLALGVSNAEVVDDRLGFVHPLPAAEPLDGFPGGRLPVDQVVQITLACVGQCPGDFVIALLRSAPLDQTPQYDVPHTLAILESWLLLENVDTCPPTPRDLSSIRRFDAAEHPAEGALPASAVAHQTHTFPPANRQADAGEDRAVSIGLQEFLAVDYGHGARE